jgi:hypothetical protein
LTFHEIIAGSQKVVKTHNFKQHKKQAAVAQGKNPSAAASLRLNASRSTKTLAIDPLISKKQITQTGPSE